MFKKKYLILIVTFSIMVGLLFAHAVQAQNWANLPPYNLMWPLWSPTLSPPDPVSPNIGKEPSGRLNCA